MSYTNRASVPALKEFGLFPVVIEEVKSEVFKTKAGKEIDQVVVVMAASDGRKINWNFRKPLTDISKNQIKSLIKAAGGTEGSLVSIKDKSVVVLVAPNEVNGSTYWNPNKVFAASYAKYLKKGSSEFGLDEPSPSDVGNEDSFGL